MTDLRKEARGRPCLVRLPGCNGVRGTTVLAHYALAGYRGIGKKTPDIMAAFACSHCHDVVDGRVKTEHDRQVIRLAHAEGCLRTMATLEDEGKIKT